MSRCFFTGGLVTVSDVFFSPVYDVSQKCRLAPQAVQEIFDAIAHAIDHPPSLLRDVIRDGSETITTGDVHLDKMLGGGIRVGMIWELLPVAQGGLNGSACYLTTSTGLPTPRLIELLHEHPLLVGSHCTLDNIQTSVTKSVDSLLYALSEVLPALMDAANARSMPLKLLVIDSLAELLLEDKVSTATLADRSRNLSAIAAQLHALAATRQLAVLAINRVTDVWERRPDADPGMPGELIYAEHARIFGRAEGASKSAALGLVWANQINARVFLARTARRRALPAEKSRDRKRQRTEGGGAAAVAIVRADDVVVRRLSVVFGAVCAPAEVDFIITSGGVETCADDAESGGAPGPAAVSAAALALATNVVRPPLAEVSPLDVGSVAEDDEEAYWRDMDDFTAFGEGIDLL
ncbi:hypothetical protein EDB84DRAFT_1559290 [Lactarius hengduanensis]|nr:hypothetical protein EDB84DRAFT_1559290 [Lactarius hengduanensis]